MAKTTAPALSATNPVADRVHGALRPLFEAIGPCAYPNDFLVHDREQLQRKAMPGMSFWWTLSSFGTHLLYPGAEVSTAKAAMGHRNTQAFRVDVGTVRDSVRPLTPEEFYRDVASFQTCLRELDVQVDRPDRWKRVVRVSGKGGWLASATIALAPQTHETGAPTARVEITTNTEQSIKGFEFVLILDTLDNYVTREMGTVFWQRQGQTLIDGVAQKDWLLQRLVGFGVMPRQDDAPRQPSLLPQ